MGVYQFRLPTGTPDRITRHIQGILETMGLTVQTDRTSSYCMPRRVQTQALVNAITGKRPYVSVGDWDMSAVGFRISAEDKSPEELAQIVTGLGAVL